MDGALKLDIASARERIGQTWGLDRPITKMELARALRMSPVNGGDHISRMEKGKANISGPVFVAIHAFLEGHRPDNMDDVIKPGYPRGPVR